MLALQISSMKQFMNHLLVADTFESFLLEEAVIGTACTFYIDGHVNQEFFHGRGHTGSGYPSADGLAAKEGTLKKSTRMSKKHGQKGGNYHVREKEGSGNRRRSLHPL